MDYKDELARLERFRTLVEEYIPKMNQPGDEVRQLAQRVSEAYGEVEDIVEKIVGRSEIKVEIRGSTPPTTYPNLIEAGFLSGRTIHTHQGYNQLLKVIGRVRALAERPVALRDEQSLSGLIRVLSRFRECCQYLRDVPGTEAAVQDIVWIMLRSHFDRVDREDTLPRFGVKNYRPDFGIPELQTLIEVKFIGDKTNVGSIQEEILADLPGYLADQARYSGVVVFVYDSAHKLRDPRKFVDDLRAVEGIVEVLVIPGLS